MTQTWKSSPIHSKISSKYTYYSRKKHKHQLSINSINSLTFPYHYKTVLLSNLNPKNLSTSSRSDPKKNLNPGRKRLPTPAATLPNIQGASKKHGMCFLTVFRRGSRQPSRRSQNRCAHRCTQVHRRQHALNTVRIHLGYLWMLSMGGCGGVATVIGLHLSRCAIWMMDGSCVN